MRRAVLWLLRRYINLKVRADLKKKLTVSFSSQDIQRIASITCTTFTLAAAGPDHSR